MLRAVSLLLFCCICAWGALAEPSATPPAARREAIADTIYGVRVDDPYRWLEATESPEVQTWATDQNSVAEQFAGPGVSEREARILALSDHLLTRSLARAGARTFFLRGWPGVVSQGLYVGDPSGNAQRLDGASIESGDVSESTTAYWPSPDGRLVVTLTTPLRSNWGELRLIEVSSARVLARRRDVHATVTTGAWLAGGSEFAYSGYDRDQDAPIRGHLMVMDRAGAAREVFSPPAESGPRVLGVIAAQDRARVFVEARNASAGVSDLYVIAMRNLPQAQKIAGGHGLWTPLGGRGDSVWVYTNAGTPNGRVERFDHLSRSPQERITIAESSGAISGNSQVGGNAMGVFGDRIALLYQEEARPVVRVFDLEGRPTGAFEIPPTGAIWGGFFGDARRSELYYGFLGIAEPSSIYRAELHTGHTALIASTSVGFRSNDIIAERTFVQRPDGARVPVLVARRRGLDMSQPHRTILYGYGALGWVSFLWYQPQIIDWMLHDDGVFVVAGVRGGGEFGNAWHEAGRKLHRQTAIDDYVAVAQHLIDSHLTTSALLAANGGSISGGLVGAAANQRPDLFGAVLLDYAVLDLVRYPLFGHARLWVDELGSPDNADEFRVLLSVSPYHTIPQGRCPPTLVRVGPNDATVTPAHGYKYAAALQAACSAPIYLDVMEGAGHNYGSTPQEAAHNHAVALEFLNRVLH